MAESATTGSESAMTDSPLMKLPPELRNRIYRYTVVGDSKIFVTHNGLREPELLHVCTQIRTEALGIFYSENVFSVENQNYDSSAVR